MIIVFNSSFCSVYFSRACVWVHVCTPWAFKGPEKSEEDTIGSSETVLQEVVSLHVGVGNGVWILCTSKELS